MAATADVTRGLVVDGRGPLVANLQALWRVVIPVVTGGVAQNDAQGCLPVLGPCPPPGTGGGDCVLGCAPTTTPPAPPG